MFDLQQDGGSCLSVLLSGKLHGAKIDGARSVCEPLTPNQQEKGPEQSQGILQRKGPEQSQGTLERIPQGGKAGTCLTESQELQQENISAMQTSPGSRA